MYSGYRYLSIPYMAIFYLPFFLISFPVGKLVCSQVQLVNKSPSVALCNIKQLLFALEAANKQLVNKTIEIVVCPLKDANAKK